MFCDYLNNKKQIIFGLVFVALYYSVYLFCSNKISLVIAQVFYSIGLTLIDINTSVWLAMEVHKISILEDRLLWSKELTAVGGAFYGMLLCFFSMRYRHESTYNLMYVSSIFMTILLIFFINKISYCSDRVVEKTTTDLYVKDKKRSNLWIGLWLDRCKFIAIASISWCGYQPLFHFWQPLVSMKNLDVFPKFSSITDFKLGLAFFIMNVATLFANKLARHTVKYHANGNNIGVLFGVFLIVGYFFLGPKFKDGIYSLMLLSLLHGSLSVITSISRAYLLKSAPEEVRGKIISLSEISCRISGTVFLIILSRFLGQFGVEKTFCFCSIIGVFICLIFLAQVKPNSGFVASRSI